MPKCSSASASRSSMPSMSDRIEVGLVEHRLEARHVRREVVVVGDERGDPRVVLGRLVGEHRDRRRRAHHRTRPLDERHRRLRRRQLRRVAGHRRPQRRGRDVGLRERRLQHADDAGRTLVARALELEALDQGVVGGGADQVHRPAVRHVGEQRTERDGHRCPEVPGEPGDLLGRTSATAAPARARARGSRRCRAATPTTPRRSATRSRVGAAPSRRTCGRTVAKSVNGSGSISASGGRRSTRPACATPSKRHRRRRSSP